MSWWRRWPGLVVAVIVAVLVASGILRQCVSDVAELGSAASFGAVSTPVAAGAAGQLIRSERLLGAPNGAVAWRVLYHSRDLRGADIPVSGIVVAPVRPAPSGGWPVVSWAHPTTGSSVRCAPSRGVDPFLLIAGLHELLDAGYVVAATDYSGMGSDGPPSYLIGATEAANVLDAARAARNLRDAHAGAEVILWGHSQGGQAALFAAQQATVAAPELQVRGVAVAAPAAELAQLLDDHEGDVSGVTIGSYAFDAITRVYGSGDPRVRLDAVLTPAGQAVLPRIVPQCLLSDLEELHRLAAPVAGKFFAVDPATTEPWASILRDNTPGAERIGVPILVTQGDADELVRPATTTDLVSRLCATGGHVTYRTFPHVDHGLAGERSVPLLLSFLDGLRHGQPLPSDCASPTPTASATGPSNSTSAGAIPSAIGRRFEPLRHGRGPTLRQ